MTIHNIAKAVSAFSFVVLSANALTMLVWAFRYIWFSQETVPLARLGVSIGLACTAGMVIAIAATVAHETRHSNQKN